MGGDVGAGKDKDYTGSCVDNFGGSDSIGDMLFK